jgi:hypothetical protein
MRLLARASALLLALLPVPLAGKGVLVSPSHFYLSAGDESVQTLVVKPTTAEPTRVAIGVQPFLLDADGRPRLGARDGENRSLASLVTIEPAFILLEGAPATVTVRVHAPARGGSAWAAIVLDVEPVEGDGGVAVMTRVIVPVVVTRETRQPPHVVLEGLRARAEVGGLEVTALVRNDDTSVVRAGAELILEESAADGFAETARSRVSGLVLFPGVVRRVLGHLPAAPPAGAARVVRIVVPVGEIVFEAEVVPES